MTKRYRQFALEQGDSRLVCWLEDDSRLKKGVSISLVGVPGWWVVQTCYRLTVEDKPETRWQVGGLT
jgi:hypothetical protein